MEKKTFASYNGIINPEGIVEKIVAVFGNVDEGGDRIWPGAFSKTIQERGLIIKGMDQHDSRSVRNVVAKTLEMREIGREELPPGLLENYPEATGGLYVKAQYILGTQSGREVFTLIQEGAIGESSIGYDPIQMDYTKERGPNGKDITVRNLRELKLYEWSDVVWAMNPATVNLSAKDGGGPSEGKPYGFIQEGDVYYVYRLDGDGEPMGDPLGEHETEDDAQEQVEALYAQEAGEESSAAEDPEEMKGEGENSAAEDPEEDKGDEESYLRIGEYPSWFKVANMADWIESRIHYSFTTLADDLFGEGRITREERIALSGLIGSALDIFHSGLQMDPLSALRNRRPWEEVTAFREEIARMSGDGISDSKAGRVLARRNADRLNTALGVIMEILGDAGLLELEQSESDEEDESKQGNSAPQGKDGAAVESEPAEAAGPDDNPPTTEERMALIRSLELELLEVQ